ncbi:MAG: DUF1848 domain-containing protein [Deltaproteobacteria bacterium]|nr:DUF1848 domain-containing protein [Deltaproteobacteria bacterium]
MEEQQKIVLSASRRTDVPAFYLDWFLGRLEKGFFAVENPFNRVVTNISARPEDVHSIVFWSKNYGPMLSSGAARRIRDMGFRAFFHFTINSPCPDLEPRVPPLAERLDQLARLSDAYSPAAVAWRFDPICFYTKKGVLHDNLEDFSAIARAAAGAGITRCVTSFMDPYNKIARRMAKRPDMEFACPEQAQREEILRGMKAVLDPLGIDLYLCCERRLAQSLESLGVRPHACVDHHLLARLYGPEGLSFQQDRGQRTSAGCGCHESRDVGSYRNQPCRHRCIYCYANPDRS